MVNALYSKSIASICEFPSIGGVPEGRGGPQNENDFENENAHEIMLFLILVFILILVLFLQGGIPARMPQQLGFRHVLEIIRE